ncbi:MAG TPA: hypothetical protein VK215_05145 [Acidimicrobiales bacterium]|nr:hypothetical protein [Acidimicrobiales bacterium]HLN41812.1 hypothetical protein [Acidimicrobiales bacterium]
MPTDFVDGMLAKPAAKEIIAPITSPGACPRVPRHLLRARLEPTSTVG